jgi:hypothetical protein
MSIRTTATAGGGRNPRRFGCWLVWLAWLVARRAPALACSLGFLSDPAWRQAYDAGLTPEQAFAIHPSRWEA